MKHSALLLVLTLLALPVRADYSSAYVYAPGGGAVDIGVQPMSYPLAFISSVMQRDRVLRKQLPQGVSFHPFRTGNDMLQVTGNGKLEAMLLGDMPTISMLVHTPMVIVGLAKKNFSSVIAHGMTRFEQLRGKRIGYAHGSSSHYSLLQGLNIAGMSEKDVRMVVMEPTAMPAALASGQIDAFSAWEPTPAIALNQDKRNRAIYKSLSSGWFLMTREFAEGQPAQALAVVAAYVRAINWMRASGRHLEQATRWVISDGEKFTGRTLDISIQQATSLARRDLLDIPGIPVVLELQGTTLPLQGELQFLQAHGKVTAEVDETLLSRAFAYTGLREVQAAARHYRIYEYDYAE